jgi:cell division protein YceG involved in septum cleavage
MATIPATVSPDASKTTPNRRYALEGYLFPDTYEFHSARNLTTFCQNPTRQTP